MPTTYVYRRAGSDGARALADAIGGRRWRDTRTPLSQRAQAGDRVIAWGEEFSKAGVHVLNGGPIRNKFSDAETLRAAGVATIEVARQRPVVAPAAPPAPLVDPAIALWNRASELAEDFIEDNDFEDEVPRIAPRLQGIREFQSALNDLSAALNAPRPVAAPAPAVPDATWIGRSSNHTGGTDLLRGNGADYWVRKEEFVREYRVHSFLGRSIRAGKKDLREGFTLPSAGQVWTPGGTVAHPWVRSWDGGWRIVYDGVSLDGRNAVRELAHNAVRALGLDFGAVDIGERANGTYAVLEVNRAPGLEGGTVTSYANAIGKWISGEWTADNRAAQRRRAA